MLPLTHLNTKVIKLKFHRISQRLNHQAEKVYLEQLVTAEEVLMFLPSTCLAYFWDVDGMDKCFAKMPKDDRVEGIITVLMCAYAWLHTYLGYILPCCFPRGCVKWQWHSSLHGDRMNASQWSKYCWHALRRRVLYMLGWGFGIHKNNSKFFLTINNMCLSLIRSFLQHSFPYLYPSQMCISTVC